MKHCSNLDGYKILSSIVLSIGGYRLIKFHSQMRDRIFTNRCCNSSSPCWPFLFTDVVLIDVIMKSRWRNMATARRIWPTVIKQCRWTVDAKSTIILPKYVWYSCRSFSTDLKNVSNCVRTSTGRSSMDIPIHLVHTSLYDWSPDTIHNHGNNHSDTNPK